MDASSDAKIISIVFDEAASKKQACNAQFHPGINKASFLECQPVPFDIFGQFRTALGIVAEILGSN